MSRLSMWLWNQRLQTIVGATLIPLLIFFLIKSSETGHADYEAAELALSDIRALDLEINGALFPLLFEIQTDFDELTRIQTEYREAVAAYNANFYTGQASPLVELVGQKNQLLEDFKARQAVIRNSRAIATEMIDDARERPSIAAAAENDLFEVERSFLDFIGRRDPPSIARLRESIAEIEAGDSALADVPEWETFVAHAETIVRYVDQMTELMGRVFSLPVVPQLDAELDAMTAAFEAHSRTASAYRFAMFAVALVLLAFSAYKALQVRRYYLMLGKANDELEHRVTERTRELSEANRALQCEIRERLAVESQLRIAQKLESIGQLAAGIAHEINTPTQYVSDNVTFLSTAWRDLAPVLKDYERAIESGSLDTSASRVIWKRAEVEYLRDEVPAALESAAEGLGQIGRIVRAIRDFSHPGDDTLQPENVNRAIENAVTVASNEWKYVAELSLDLDPELPDIPCNVSAFNQVILNLIVNAAQAIETAPPEDGVGRIVIRTRLADDHALIVIEDDGPGIPESIRDQIFDPFFTTKEVGKGTGQGLAIAFRVVTKQHGGTLALEAASGGRGARFTITLPLEQPDRDARVGDEDDLADTIRTLELHARS